MPFQLIREDITIIKVDVIVNPTDSHFTHKGGTDKQIHDVAGTALFEACKKHIPIQTSDVVITPSFDMDNTDYVIHTVGPRYKDGLHNEEKELYACYKNALDLAKEYKFESIAFPLISSGTFSFPKGEALKIATAAITDFLLDSDMYVYLLVYDNSAFDMSKKIFLKVEDYLAPKEKIIKPLGANKYEECVFDRGIVYKESIKQDKAFKKEALIIDEPDEEFHEYLQRIMREKGLTDPKVYNAVNLDRKLFNNIINGKKKQIRKETAVVIAIGMKLNIKETKELVERSGSAFAGYTLFDKLIKFCLKEKIYNIYEINELLLAYDQVTLGSKTRDED